MDGKVGKTICRLYFNEKTGTKEIRIPDNTEAGKYSQSPLSTLDEIYGVAEFLKSRIRNLTKDSYKGKPEKSEIT